MTRKISIEHRSQQKCAGAFKGQLVDLQRQRRNVGQRGRADAFDVARDGALHRVQSRLGRARDALVDARCSQALARAWGVPLAIHPDAGHDLPLDAGPWVVERVRAWAAAPQSAPTRPPETAP